LQHAAESSFSLNRKLNLKTGASKIVKVDRRMYQKACVVHSECSGGTRSHIGPLGRVRTGT
jgi:hypothetical protein